MKVFDCQNMPGELRTLLFDTYQKNNDSCMEFWIGDGVEGKAYQKIEDWLMINGAERGESVMIKYWW